MRKLISFLLISIAFIACKKDNQATPDYFIDFRPRECTYLFVVPALAEYKTYENHNYYEYSNLIKNSTIKSDHLFFSVQTCNYDLRSFIKANGGYMSYLFISTTDHIGTHISSLEELIELDYSRIAINGDNGSVNANLEEMEYRTSGVKAFSIKALDGELFGLPAGSSLNDYFKIIKYSPDFLASASSNTLLYGFSSTDKPASIDEWLNLKSLAQPSMYVKFKSNPPELPINTRFVVELTTDDGSLLTDTTQILQIVE